MVDRNPEEVFAAINNPRAWWTGTIEGSTDKVGKKFVYSYSDFHKTTQLVKELVPGKLVVWHVTEATLTFATDPHEWVGTNIIFEISVEQGQTKLMFTHEGLTPEQECYSKCSNAWNRLITVNLKNFIESAT